jgi:broad specificity phosphatase PhoE
MCRHAETGNVVQAHELADALMSLPVVAVYTSPLARATETARPVARAHGLAPVEIDGLREIELGEVEGLEFDAFPPALRAGLLHDPTAVRFPGGETYDELQRRVCAALDDIVARHPEHTVVAVTHAGPIRSALAAWLGIEGEKIFRIDQRYAAVNVVDWIGGAPIVRLVNGTRPNG